jgi:hypothetical protein
VTIHSPDSRWGDGTYTLEVAFDAARYTCTFTAPNALPPGYRAQRIECTPALDAFVQAEVTCEEFKVGDNVGQNCTPIPDEYHVAASTEGTPVMLSVTLQRGSDTLLDETRPFSYSTSEPNGPECGPTCYGALADLTLE